MKRQILAVVPYWPSRIRIRTLQNIYDWSKLADIDLVVLAEGKDAKIELPVRSLEIIDNSSKVRRLWRIVSGLVLRRPITYQYYASSKVKNLLYKKDLYKYDCVIVERLSPNELGIEAQRVVVDMVDCFSVQVDLMWRYVRGVKRWLYGVDKLLIAPYEKSLANSADAVAVTVPREAVALRDLGVKVPIHAITHKVAEFHTRSFAIQQVRGTVSFHGKLGYIANRIAVRELDRIAEKLGDEAKIKVVGPAAGSLERECSHLEFVGYVDSLRDELVRSWVGCFPVSISVGVPNKVLEALGCGVPVVITKQLKDGLPGVESLLEQGVFVGEIADFPDILRRVLALNDKERRVIGEACVEYVNYLNSDDQRLNQWEQFLFDGKGDLGRA